MSRRSLLHNLQRCFVRLTLVAVIASFGWMVSTYGDVQGPEDSRWGEKLLGKGGISIGYSEAVASVMNRAIFPKAQTDLEFAKSDWFKRCEYDTKTLRRRVGGGDCRIAGYSPDYYICQTPEYNAKLCANVSITRELFDFFGRDYMRVLMSDCERFVDDPFLKQLTELTGYDVGGACAKHPEKQVIYVKLYRRIGMGEQQTLRIENGKITSRRHRDDPWVPYIPKQD